MASGEDAGVADAGGDAYRVGLLEPSLGVLAARAQAVSKAGERDLAFLPAGGLYLLQDRLRRVGGRKEPVGEPYGLAALEEQARCGCGLRRGWLYSGPAQGFKKLFCLSLQLRRHLFGVRQAHSCFVDPDLWIVPA